MSKQRETPFVTLAAVLALVGACLVLSACEGDRDTEAPDAPVRPQYRLFAQPRGAEVWLRSAPGDLQYSKIAWLALDGERWVDQVLLTIDALHPEQLQRCDNGIPPWVALRRIEVDANGTLLADVATGASCALEQAFDAPAMPTFACAPDDEHSDRLRCSSSHDEFGETKVSYRVRRWYSFEASQCTNDVCPFSLDIWSAKTASGDTDELETERFVLDCDVAPELCQQPPTVFGVVSPSDEARWCATHPGVCPR